MAEKQTDQPEKPETPQPAAAEAAAEAPAAETKQAETPAAEAPAAEAVPEQGPAAEATPPPAAEDTSRPANPLPEGTHYIWGTGRRKTAVARVRIRPGNGGFVINKRTMEQYFPFDRDRSDVVAPLQTARMLKSWDVWVNVHGGGYTGQAGAVRLGLARALAKAMPDVEEALRDQGMLTRDARMVERKKPGQPGARRRFQFSKR